MFYSAGWRSGTMAGTSQLWLTDFIWSTGILQALGWNSWWNKPKHQSDVQTWEISDISTGERHGNSGYWCSSWDPNTLIFALKAPFLPHLFSSLRLRELFVKWFLLPLELFLPFLPPVKVHFSQMKQCSNTSVGSGGNLCFPGCPWHAIYTWDLSVPLLLSLMFLGTFLAMSSGWQGRYQS